MRLPEAVGEDPEPEVDAAAAEEERADEEDAGREHADPRVRAVREVLVDRARAGVAPGVERDRVGDREHAEAGEQHGERRVPARADVRPRDAAEDERDREHRPDRERLRDRVDRREVLLAKRPTRRATVGLTHAITPSRVVPGTSSACAQVAATIKGSNIECQPSPSPSPEPTAARTLRVRSVVGLAYDEVRALIVAGSVGPGSRLGQGELADQLGISRGSVREALRRLAGDGLVEFEVNRGFFVSDLGLGQVRQRLEARLVLEPAIARLAAERRTDDRPCGDALGDHDRAGSRSSDDAHDASRAFHLVVAAATRNEAFVRLLEGLWIADVGRRLLAERRRVSSWQDDDVAEHEAIVLALESRDGERAAALMRAHVASAVRHWSPRGGS